VLLSLAILAGAGGYYYKFGPFAPGPIPAADWQPFTTADGLCRLDVPGEFVEQYKVVAHGPGTVRMGSFDRTWRYYLSRDREESEFVVTYSDRVKDTPFDEIYRAERDYVLEYLNMESSEEKEITLDGHEGREFRVDLGWRGRLLARVLRVPGPSYDRIYTVVATGRHLDNHDGERFLESLRVVEGK
jgi:hypothetical protein